MLLVLQKPQTVCFATGEQFLHSEWYFEKIQLNIINNFLCSCIILCVLFRTVVPSYVNKYLLNATILEKVDSAVNLIDKILFVYSLICPSIHLFLHQSHRTLWGANCIVNIQGGYTTVSRISQTYLITEYLSFLSIFKVFFHFHVVPLYRPSPVITTLLSMLFCDTQTILKETKKN